MTAEGDRSAPLQPSAHEAEGLDRFGRTPRIKAGGVARARRLRTDPTFTEARLWKHLRRFAVRFRRQAPIGAYVVDFACHRARLVIEVDGGVHNLPEVAVRDMVRDEWLAGQGYRVLRFTTRQVEDDIDAVLQAICKASPLPLEGEGVGGWGEGTPHQTLAREALSDPVPSPFEPASNHPASTPSQPFPLEGKGSSEI